MRKLYAFVFWSHGLVFANRELYILMENDQHTFLSCIF